MNDGRQQQLDDRSEVESASRTASRLQGATIAWNCLEVLVTVALGISARSLALVAFGMDSLVEVFASLVVVWHLRLEVTRQGRAADRRALRLVAVSFAVLATMLIAASIRSLVIGTEPDSSPIGIAYLAVTACVMFSLAVWKRRVGRRLASEPLLAEASMTFLDGWLASGILTALALNTAFGWWWADPAAAAIVASVAARESWSLWRDGAEVPDLQGG